MSKIVQLTRYECNKCKKELKFHEISFVKRMVFAFINEAPFNPNFGSTDEEEELEILKEYTRRELLKKLENTPDDGEYIYCKECYKELKNLGVL